MLYTRCYTQGGKPRLIQNLNPDDLAFNLMATHEPDVVIQVALAVEGLDR